LMQRILSYQCMCAVRWVAGRAWDLQNNIAVALPVLLLSPMIHLGCLQLAEMQYI